MLYTKITHMFLLTSVFFMFNIEVFGKPYSVDFIEYKEKIDVVTSKKNTRYNEKNGYEYVCESLKIEDNSGVLKMSWENPEGDLVYIEVYYENASGELVLVETFHSRFLEGHHLVLNQQQEERNYVFIVKDIDGNRCDDIKVLIAPRSSDLLNKNNYRAIYQKHDTPTPFSYHNLLYTYDGKLDGYYYQIYHSTIHWIDPDGELPEYVNWSYNGENINVSIITWDIGGEVQLSKFKYWPRMGNYIWRHLNPHIFDLWGTDQLNEDGSLDGWTLLLENVGPVKPSGTLTNDENTEEDIAAAEAGFVFDIPEEMPKVRYIRFVQKLAQNKVNAWLHLDEVEFFGEISGGNLSNREFELKDSVQLYPNPANNLLNIANAQGLNISIYSIMGKEVLTSEIEQTNQRIDITSLKTGVYFVKIGSSNSSVTKKMVKN